jgi:hypothetical protein
MIGAWPQTCRTLRIAMLCGLVLYYGVVPIEFLFTGEYRVKNDFIDFELSARSLIDGPSVVVLAFLGFWLGTTPLARVNRKAMIRASDLGTCAASIAKVLVVAFFVIAARTEISNKSINVELAATSDNDYAVGFNSLVLAAAAAASGVTAASYAFGAATRRQSILWLILVLILGGIGLRFGDKDPMGASVFMFIASFVLWLRGNVLSTIFACALCVGGLFALPAASMVKFMFFGIDPDLSLLLIRPSSSDPGGAFALMATAMDSSVPLGLPGYSGLSSISNDIGSAVPRWLWSGRPQAPGAEIASFVMGSSYVEGFGIGYSPYLDLYCALGHIGIIAAGLTIGSMVTLLLRIAAYVDPTSRLMQVCAVISFYVLVVSQRLSLMGSLKQLLYYNATTIAAFLLVLLCQRVRHSIGISPDS